MEKLLTQRTWNDILSHGPLVIPWQKSTNTENTVQKNPSAQLLAQISNRTYCHNNGL